jgi:hypothetical protein
MIKARILAFALLIYITIILRNIYIGSYEIYNGLAYIALGYTVFHFINRFYVWLKKIYIKEK